MWCKDINFTDVTVFECQRLKMLRWLGRSINNGTSYIFKITDKPEVVIGRHLEYIAMFADGDRSLLSLPSVCLACWCELGFIVVILSLASLSVSSLPANRPVCLPKCETRQPTETTKWPIRRVGDSPSDWLNRCVMTRLVGRVCSAVCIHQKHFDDDTEQTLTTVHVIWTESKNCRNTVEFVTVNS